MYTTQGHRSHFCWTKPICRCLRLHGVLAKVQEDWSPSQGDTPSCSIPGNSTYRLSVRTIVNMYQIGNIYFITAIAVIGGGLFGFDISSMSAIIGTDQYKW